MCAIQKVIAHFAAGKRIQGGAEALRQGAKAQREGRELSTDHKVPTAQGDAGLVRGTG